MGALKKTVVFGALAAALYGAHTYATRHYPPTKHPSHASHAQSRKSHAKKFTRNPAAPSLERRVSETITTPQGTFLLDHTYERACVDGPRPETRFVIVHQSGGHYQALNSRKKMVLGGDIETLHYKRGANYYLDKQGVVHALMPANCMSLGAGRSIYAGVTGLNRFSVNVELEGLEGEKPTEPQYVSGAALFAYLKTENRLSDAAFKAHAEVAANKMKVRGKNIWVRDRRTDGMGFDWAKFGISHSGVDPDYQAGRAIYGENYQKHLAAARGHSAAKEHWYDGIVNLFGRMKEYVAKSSKEAKSRAASSPSDHGVYVAKNYATVLPQYSTPPASRYMADSTGGDGVHRGGNLLSLAKRTATMYFSPVNQR